MQNKTWFTLVELIVVITILSVLATIWFVSFTWYWVSARDSVRLADTHSIEKSLWIYKLKNSRYPIPEDKVDITSSWRIVNYQWYAGKQVLWSIWVHWGWVDPLTQEYYTYATNANRVKYQLLSYFEDLENVNKQAWLVSNSYANVSNMYPQLSWDKVWIVINNTTKEPLQKSGMNLDISQPTSTYEVHMSNNEVVTGTNVSLWIIYPKSSCNRLKENDNSLQDGKYMIEPLADGNEIEVLCDMTTDGGGWTLYTWKNIHELPTIWFLEVHPQRLQIKFNQIRWNYRSPLWLEMPLIYDIYSLNEAILLLSSWERIDADAWDNMDLHYKNTQDFSQALSFWEKNTSWVSIDDFRLWVTQNNISYMSSWKNTTTNEYYTNMWTSFPWNKSNVSKYLWFPSTPYYSTYKIWDETFEWISAYANWTDDRSIAIWIK
jgi:prepilin-type N-terminal cleavage/methylation domain-containing protein